MTLTTTGQNNQKTRDEIGQGSSTFPKIKNFTEQIPIEQGPSIIEHSSVTGSAIYGSATFGVYGTSTYGSSAGGTFILGHSLFGILGTGELGTGSSTLTYSVTNPNNKFIERFGFDYFEDSGNTTADWDVTNRWLLFANTEIAQSNSVYLNDTNIINATFNCGFDTGDSSDVIVQLSGDGGSNWETITIGTKHSFSNIGTSLMFKLTASDTVKITWIKIEYNS